MRIRRYAIAEATAYFRVHADSKLYFVFMPSVTLMHTATQLPIGADRTPLSPRVAKPVLAYSGSLPKDYFRCPCCGAVVDAPERATVPFRMVLQHLQKLDMADGVVDGDSPALRAIAATLDKVSRNPQYYAALYARISTRNPTENTQYLLKTCGFPGGDLELDDQLENPAELICFRLLQVGMTRVHSPCACAMCMRHVHATCACAMCMSHVHAPRACAMCMCTRDRLSSSASACCVARCLFRPAPLRRPLQMGARQQAQDPPSCDAEPITLMT